MGRPRHDIDARADEIRALAYLGATQIEIAAYLGVHQSTISRRVTDDPDGPVARAMEEGKAQGSTELRRLQWVNAKKGDTTMLIWLGKNILGQTDQYTTKKVEERHIEVTLRLGTKEVKRLDGDVVDGELVLPEGEQKALAEGVDVPDT
jgi:hypothetical protein